MIYIVWQFQINESKKGEFEQAYSSKGKWADLFQKSQCYHGTKLLKVSDSENIYVTLDMWENIEAFEKFKKQYAVEYNKLDDLCEHYTIQETKVGLFEDMKEAILASKIL